MTTSTGDPVIDQLYRGRKGRVDVVDVPELGFVMIDGEGDPNGPAFAEALQALYSVSYTVHFALKKATGAAPRVMPLEAQWWLDGPDAEARMRRLVVDPADTATGRDDWRWTAMIAQLDPITAADVEAGVAQASDRKPTPGLDSVRYERWTEGSCAQVMHVGPYATEAASLTLLHTTIDERGYRPRGRHHEIYLGDPRTAAPEKLRTLLRQPIEPA